MYYVYILFSNKLKKFYTGRTTNLKRRLEEHNSKKVPFTSRGCPWDLAFYEAFINEKDSIDEEKFLKSGKERERRSYLLRNYIQSIGENGTKGRSA
ncbi:MAG: hypothetical protein Kow0081_4060 [Candidatus Dojkabacteria bacterium]